MTVQSGAITPKIGGALMPKGDNERGKHAPDFLTVRNLAKVLGVPAAYFYAEDDNLAELIVLFWKLKAAERKSLLTSARSLMEGA